MYTLITASSKHCRLGHIEGELRVTKCHSYTGRLIPTCHMISLLLCCFSCCCMIWCYIPTRFGM